jgi:hypothetical protein
LNWRKQQQEIPVKMILFFALLLPFTVNAQDGVSSASMSTGSRVVEFYDVEAQLYATSISPSMTIGPALAYQMSDSEKIGFRALAPLNRNDDVSALSFSGYWRHTYTPKQTSFFSEFGISHNIFAVENNFSNSSAFSVEAGVGLTHRLTQEMGIGGLAGLSASQANVTRSEVETSTSEIFLYPRLALFGSFEF